MSQYSGQSQASVGLSELTIRFPFNKCYWILRNLDIWLLFLKNFFQKHSWSNIRFEPVKALKPSPMDWLRYVCLSGNLTNKFNKYTSSWNRSLLSALNQKLMQKFEEKAGRLRRNQWGQSHYSAPEYLPRQWLQEPLTEAILDLL